MAETFVPGDLYRRTALHARYGGQEQGGISTPSAHPLIFLITGESGHLYGYKDGPHPDGTFWYTGEGQVGDMKMIRGNSAIRDHQVRQRSLHLFEDVGGGMLRYISQAEYAGHHIETAPDKNENPRKAIVFELALESPAEGTPPKNLHDSAEKLNRDLKRRSLAELRRMALERASTDATPAQRKANAYQRSGAIREYVLARAKGICEGCLQAAPFLSRDNRPYLEPHHIRRRSDGGPDHPRWVAAVCPNCHRHVHSGKNGADFNEQIAERIGRIEGD
jgi:5-methylcytosine-specific restriction protein A